MGPISENRFPGFWPFTTTWRCALAAIVGTLLFLGPEIVSSMDMPVEEIDEAAVYFSTYYFDLAFLQRDLRSSDWQAVDAVDHPPVWKYAYGAVLFASGTPRGRLGDKEEWFRLGWGSPRLSDFIEERAPLSVLLPLRITSAILVLLSLALLFVLALRVASPFVALLTVLAAALHPVVQTVATRALIDPLLLFLILLATVLFAQWLHALAGNRRFVWSIVLGICLALLLNTKITGVAMPLAIVVATACFAAVSERPADVVRRAAAPLALVLTTTVLAAIAVNPTLYHTPFATFDRMVKHRRAQVERQMRVFGRGPVSLGEGVQGMVRHATLRPDPVYRATRVPLVALLAIYGAWRFARRVDWRSPWVCAWLASSLLWLLITGATYRLPWYRYLLPVVTLLAMLVALAIHGLATTAQRWWVTAQNAFSK